MDQSQVKHRKKLAQAAAAWWALRRFRERPSLMVTTREFYPEDYYQGDPPASGEGDWSAAFLAMLQDPQVSPVGTGNTRRIGSRIVLRPNYDYHFHSPLLLNRPHHIIGAGQGASWGNTVLSFEPGIEGVVIPWFGEVTYDPAGSIGFGATVENLQILAPRGANDVAATPTDHGIHIRGTCAIKSVRVYGFGGDGIHIDGNGQNANNWYIEHAHVQSCGRRGFYVIGSDGNAGLALGLNLTTNCRNAPPFDDTLTVAEGRYAACGLYDDSFLGNTYVGTHVNQYNYPAYVCNDNPSGPSVFFGAYEERGGEPSEVQTALLLGTNIIPHTFENGDGAGVFRMLGAGVSRGVFRHEGGDVNQYRTVMGETDGQFIQMYQSIAGLAPDRYALQWDPTYNTVKMHHGGVGPSSFRLSGHNTDVGARSFSPNRLILDQEIYRGPMASARKEQFGPVSVRPTAAACNAGTGAGVDWLPGSRWINSEATGSGDVTAWRLCDDGPGGTDGGLIWREEGTIN